MRDLVNAGALDLIIATVDAGAAPNEARSCGRLPHRKGEEREVPSRPAITPAQVAEVIKLVEAKTVNNKVAKQVVDFVLDGAGDPGKIVETKGLGMVSDETALQAEVEKALIANPDIAEKIRSGKVQAAGKIVGDVMKATRGQADAARVRELVLPPASKLSAGEIGRPQAVCVSRRAARTGHR